MELGQLKAKVEKYEQAEQRLIEEFGKKSHGYGIYSGETELSEANETNQPNETCENPTTELEQVDLDEIYPQ